MEKQLSPIQSILIDLYDLMLQSAHDFIEHSNELQSLHVVAALESQSSWPFRRIDWLIGIEIIETRRLIMPVF